MGENLSSENKIQKLLELIKRLLKNKKQFKGWYSVPFADERYDYSIKYKVKRVSLHKNKYGLECVYEGTIYVEIEDMEISLEDERERVYEKDDVDVSVWEEIEDDLKNEIESLLPTFCLDVDFSFLY